MADQFGREVALEGNLAAVGSRSVGDEVRVYRRDPGTGTWAQEATIAGVARGLDVEGEWLMTGDPIAGAGAVSVYRNTSGTWTLFSTLTASDGQVGDSFGISISIEQNFVAIGASEKKNAGGSAVGGAYVFRWDGSAWIESGILGQTNSSYVGSGQGRDVSLAVGSGQARVAVAASGAKRVDSYELSGASWVFEDSAVASDASGGPTCGTGFGSSVYIGIDELVVGAPLDTCQSPNQDRGAVYSFDLVGGAWVQRSKVKEPGSIAFGSSVDVSGDAMVAGDPGYFFSAGAAYFYSRAGSVWFLQELVFGTENGIPIFAGGTPQYGDQVEISGGLSLVSAPTWSQSPVTTEVGAVSFGMDFFTSSWLNYGLGWPGTLGVPGFTLSGNPLLGSTPQLQVGNARGAMTTGYLIQGFAAANLSTGLGGTLNVDPFTITPITISASGSDVPLPLPCDPSLSGVDLFFQCLHVDPGASDGFAFTQAIRATAGSS